jgi:hypothetical protein
MEEKLQKVTEKNKPKAKTAIQPPAIENYGSRLKVFRLVGTGGWNVIRRLRGGIGKTLKNCKRPDIHPGRHIASAGVHIG